LERDRRLFLPTKFNQSLQADAAMNLWIGLPVAALGGAVTLLFARGIWKTHVTRRWAASEATLIESEIVPFDTTSWAGARGKSYQLRLKYQYQVDGQIFQGTKLTYIHNDFLSYEDASQAMAGLRKKSPLMAFHDPKDAAKAVLQHSLSDGMVSYLLGSCATFLTGLWIAFFGD
jgi:hypothetical protein